MTRFEARSGPHASIVEVRAKGAVYAVRVDGRDVVVEVLEERGAALTVLLDGRRISAGLVRNRAGWTVHVAGRVRDVTLAEALSTGPGGPHPRAAAGPVRINAPMPGRIVRVLVAPGDDVKAGQGLVVMEAMKMENEIRAPRDGRVREVAAVERQAVETGAVLAVLDPPA